LSLLFVITSLKAQLSANFSSDVTSGCIPLIVHFQDQSTGNPTQWTWNLGNGTISSQQNPTGTYFFAGTYNVKLVIKDASGSDSIIKNQYIVVHPNPIVNFSSSDTSGCFPKAILFNDLSTTATGTNTQWTWDFGDGNLSSLQTPSHTYTAGGQYNITLKVVNSFGCEKILTKSNYIQLQNATAGFSYIINGGCSFPTVVNFTNSSIGAVTYKWDFGDGTTSFIPNPVHNYGSAGGYDVKLIITNGFGCSDSLTQNVSIGEVSAAFNMPSSACVGSNVNFTNTSTPSPVSVMWYFGDGSTTTNINPQKIYATAGTYQVKLVSNFGGCSDSIIKTIIIRSKPTTSFNQTGQLVKCSVPATVNFTSTSTGATGYQWDFGDGNSATTQNAIHTYNSPGVYTVSLIASNAFGCTDTLTKQNLVAITLPQITSIGGTPYRGCSPYTVQPNVVVNSTDPVTNWFWDFGDGGTSTAANPSHFYANPGSYNIKVVITTSGGCKDSSTYVAAVVISTKPTANFSANPLVVCAKDSIRFTDLSTGSITDWFWEFGDGGTSTLHNPIYKYTDTGTFSVRLVISNNDCRDTIDIDNYIRINPPIARFSILPNCDTPYLRRFVDNSIGAVTYKWKFGDGDSSSLVNPVHIYSATGVYNVELTVYNGGCFYTTTSTVTIVDEHPTLSIADSTFCKYQQTTFTAGNVNSTNISSYSWSFGDGNSSGTSSTTTQHAYLTAGTYIPQLITTDILGCADTATGNASAIVYGPTPGFSNPEGTCINTPISFTDTSSTDGLHTITQWQWTYGDGNSQSYNASPFSHSYGNQGTFDVKLKIVDSYGCYDSILKPAIIIITDPVASFLLSDTLKCSNNNVQFQNSSNGLDLTYNWSFGDAINSNDPNPTHSYSAEGNYNVQLIVTDRFGCKDTTVKQQRISNPLAGFTPSDTFATCPPFLMTVTNQSQNVTNVMWNFGDGGNSTLNNPSHYYTQPGTYTLKLYATGFGTCIDSAFRQITLKGPSGTFNYTPLGICAGQPVSYAASTKNNATFVWDFSDGITDASTDSTRIHIYNTPGFYVPKMILIDTGGCQVPIVGNDTIKVRGVEAKIGLTQTLFCDSTALQFIDSSITHFDPAVNYQWTFGDGGTSNIRNPIHTYILPGKYTVGLTVITLSGCTDNVVRDSVIKIVQSPLIAINNNPFVCITGTIDFHGLFLRVDTSAVQWDWDLGNGNTSNNQNPSQPYNSVGNYVVKAIATNSSGCSDTATSNILVHPLPSVNAGTDTMICRGQTYILQPTGAATYLWDTDASLNCLSCSNPMASPSTNIQYVVTGISQLGCVAKDSVTISVIQPFAVRINNNDTICAGQQIQLTASGANNYNWFPSTGLSSTTINNPVARPDTTTNYMVIGRDSRNCFSDTGYMQIKVYPIPQFNITDDALTLATGFSYQLTTTNSPDITHWKWTPSTGLSCNDCPNPTIIAKSDILYKAEASNDGGCTIIDKITVTVICNDGNVFIPNTFSPNADGMNDVFYPRGKGISGIKSMKIFNRWGELVFQNMNFNPNDANAGWNGIYKNNKLTPDVYVYIVDVVCDNNAIFTLKGNVTLIR
jgi:gliding motility-associated-like protein